MPWTFYGSVGRSADTGIGFLCRSTLPIYIGPILYVALLMGLFVVAFGTRRPDATEQHRGMVGAIALESWVKLRAFLAVGAYAVWWLFDGPQNLFARAAASARGATYLEEQVRAFERACAGGQLKRSDVDTLLRGAIAANLRRAAELVCSFKMVALDVIERSGQHPLSLIHDILDLSQRIFFRPAPAGAVAGRDRRRWPRCIGSGSASHGERAVTLARHRPSCPGIAWAITCWSASLRRPWCHRPSPRRRQRPCARHG
jgi:hypothetical protein